MSRKRRKTVVGIAVVKQSHPNPYRPSIHGINHKTLPNNKMFFSIHITLTQIVSIFLHSIFAPKTKAKTIKNLVERTAKVNTFFFHFLLLTFLSCYRCSLQQRRLVAHLSPVIKGELTTSKSRSNKIVFVSRIRAGVNCVDVTRRWMGA